MSKPVKVSDLKDQTGTPGPHPFLYCPWCDGHFSANKGDYFNYPREHIFICCKEPMRLCTSRIVYEEVET